MDLVRAQQGALTVPADQLPELPAGAANRAQRAVLPDGISQEDAELSERMEMVLNDNCQIYAPSPFAVCGEIRNKYNAMGGPASFLGLPNSPEYQNPGATGYRSEFFHGSIYWSAATGAHPVTPLFMTKWNQHGWEAGWMGYPTTDEFRNLDNVGSRQEFQGAAMYWHPIQSPALGVIGGAIREKWNTVGAENGPLGYPTTDELSLNRHNGRFNDFHNGIITWSGVTGAHLLYLPIRDKWNALGREGGFLGLPTGDETITPNGAGRYTHFESGSIYQKNGLSPFAVSGEIRSQWSALGWEAGKFGFPIGDEYDMDGGRAQDFEHGTLVWNVGEPPSDFDPPTGPCPAEVCENTTSVTDPAASASLRSTQGRDLGAPTCEEVQNMPPDPTREVFCIADPEADMSTFDISPLNEQFPADSAVQEECYTNQPWLYTERLYSCIVKPIYYQVRAPGSTTPNGTASLILETEARTKWNTKKFTFRQRYIVKSTTGTMTWAKIQGVPNCWSIGENCNIDGTHMPFWEMEPGGKYFVEYEVDPGDIPTDEIRVVNELSIDHNFRPSAAYGWAEIKHVEPVYLATIRCDNKLSANKPGCIYPAEIPVLAYSNPNKNGELAGHIAAAQSSGVPGSRDVGAPLHKGTKELETENRDNACKYNPRVPSPRPEGRDCDEYPFASAREGAAAGGDERTFNGCLLPDIATGVSGPGHSVCLINPSHNRSGGSDARWFYHWNRVILDDPFYVDPLYGYLPQG